MRTHSTVKHQLRQVIYRHLQKRLRANFKKKAVTCCHNREAPLGDDGSFVRLCGVISVEGIPRNTVCDARIDDDQTARDCLLWEPLQTKDDIRDEFKSLIESERGVVASTFPDVAALMWTLDDDGDALPTEGDLSEAADISVPPDAESGWFDGILGWFGRRK